jgi:hypothetical protein
VLMPEHSLVTVARNTETPTEVRGRRLADPAAWHKLAAQFRILADQDPGDVNGTKLCAYWSSTGFNGPDDYWQLSGANDYVRRQFTWYAERAAVLHGEKIETTPLFFWLERLRKDSPRFFGPVQHTTFESGSIGSVCIASAEYCFELETEALRPTNSLLPMNNDFSRHAESTVLVNHPKLILKDYVRFKLGDNLSKLEKALEKDAQKPGFVEYATKETLGEEKYRKHKREDDEKRAINFLLLVFCCHVEAYLDNGLEQSQICILLPSLYAELLHRIFVLKWMDDLTVDRASAWARYQTIQPPFNITRMVGIV